MPDRPTISTSIRLSLLSALLAADIGSVMAQWISPGGLQPAQYTLDPAPKPRFEPDPAQPRIGTDPEATDDDIAPKKIMKNPPLHPDAGNNCSYYNGHTYCPR